MEIVDAQLRSARVIVPDYQLSLAIGKEGQNARLAAKLTGWRIDIRPDTAASACGPGGTRRRQREPQARSTGRADRRGHPAGRPDRTARGLHDGAHADVCRLSSDG